MTGAADDRPTKKRVVASSAASVQGASDSTPIRELKPNSPDTFVVSLNTRATEEQIETARVLLEQIAGEDIGAGFVRNNGSGYYFVLPNRLSPKVVSASILYGFQALLNKPPLKPRDN